MACRKINVHLRSWSRDCLHKYSIRWIRYHRLYSTPCFMRGH
jgi:hypothetical protein